MPEMIRTRLAMLALVALAPVALAAPSTRPVEPKDDALTTVMAGEFALQAGQLPDAARWYLDAARRDDDAGLAERATRIALLAKDDARAAEALKLWRARSPRTLALRGAEATLALRQGQGRQARRELAGLMQDPDELGWRYALTALASRIKGINRVILFWIAFVLTRPFGATFGDLLTKPLEKGGLGFGTVGSSLVLFTILATLVALPMLQRQAQPAS